VSLEGIEDPDVEWGAAPEPAAEIEAVLPEPEMPAEAAEVSASWLDELQGIVSGATRPLQSLTNQDVSQLGTKDLPSWDTAPAQASAAAEDFAWPTAHADEELAQAEAAPEADDLAPENDWLSAVTPNDDQSDLTRLDEPQFERSRLTERVYREPPAPEPPAVEEEAADDWESLVNATLPASESLFDSQPEQVEDFPVSGALYDSHPETDDALYASDLMSSGESLFGEPLFPDEAETAAPVSASALPNDDFTFSGFDQPLAEDDALIPEEELQTGWLHDDLFADDAVSEFAAPAVAETSDSADLPAQSAEEDDDFFSLLEADADVNLLDEDEQQQAEWSAEQALSEADFLSALNLAQAGGSLESVAEDRDFNAAFGVNPPPAAQPADAEEDDLLSQWQNEQMSEADADELEIYGQWQSETPSGQVPAEPAAQEDDFFAANGVDEEEADEQPAALPNTGELLGQWQDQLQSSEPAAAQVAEQPDDDDFYAASGLDQEDDAQPAAAPDEQEFFSVLDIGGSGAQPDAQPEEPLFTQWQDDSQADEPAAQVAQQPDDFFASLSYSDDDQQTPAALPNTGDLIAQWQDEDDPPEPVATQVAQQPDDFFASLGMEAEAESEAEEPIPEEDDFFTSLGMSDENDDTLVGALPNTGDLIAQWQDEDDQPEPAAAAVEDPFANWDQQQELPPSDDFFAALDVIDEEQQASPEMPDFFAALNDSSDDDDSVGVPTAVPAFDNVDSYLASLSSTPSNAMLDMPFASDDELDLDALFSEAMTAKSGDQSEAELLPGADQDWLAQLESSVGEVSASAIVRQQEDRPVEELSDRLKKLRQRAEEIPDDAEAADDMALSSPFLGGSPGQAQSVILTPEQEKQVAVLRALVPANERSQDARVSAIDATYDSPFMPDLEDTPETTVQLVPVAKPAKTRRRTRRKRRVLGIRLDRLLVAVVLAAAVILPFVVPGFRIGSLPPASFAAGSAGQITFDQIDALQAGDLALVGVEYGAGSAGELDGITEALLRHVIMRGALPVVVSGNAVGLLRSEARIAAINRDLDFLARIGTNEPLVENIDYYIVRYLPGGIIGLRAFSTDTANLLLTDIHGQTTHLALDALSDFALVTVITDRAEDLRAYAEQIAPLTSAPLVAAVSYSAAPLAEPYIHSMGGGLLVGYADAYTYQGLLDSVTARSIAGRLRVLPTDVPTLEATPVPEISVTQEATLPPTARPTRQPPTATIPPTEAFDSATVLGTVAVNMRGGPGTNNPVLASVPGGTVLTVLGYNDDQSWVNVRLSDGREGWISATLLSVQSAQASALKNEIRAKRQQVDEDDGGDTATPRPTSTRRPATATEPVAAATSDETEATSDETELAAVTLDPTNTPGASRTVRPSATALPSATATPTDAPTVEVTSEATVEVTEVVVAQALPPPPPSPGYRDERWYAMNGGIIASALIITLGMLINLVRGLVRRGRRA
ncbi:MAG: SH3 domain-containing protein, partial [Chloroflexota bacterium]